MTTATKVGSVIYQTTWGSDLIRTPKVFECTLEETFPDSDSILVNLPSGELTLDKRSSYDDEPNYGWAESLRRLREEIEILEAVVQAAQEKLDELRLQIPIIQSHIA